MNTKVTTADADPAMGLRSVVEMRKLADRLEIEHVANARHAGWSWEQIGDALGVTRQAVHRKYRKAGFR